MARTNRSGATVALPDMDSPAPMDFRTSATKDLSALLDRLSQVAEAATKSARAEAAAEAQITIDAVNAQRATVQQALQKQTDASDAAERANDALQRANAALEAERAKIAQDLEAVRAELAIARAAAAAEAQGTIDAVAQRATVQHALQEQTDATDAAKRANDALQRANAALEAERAKIAQDLEAARAELTASRAKVEAMRADHDALGIELRSVHVDHEALQAKFDDAVRGAAEMSARASQSRAEERRTIRDQAIGLVSRTLDRMLAVTTAFANVSTEDDVLAAVAEAMATEFPRVALFKIGLDRLDVLRHVGFEFAADYAHLVVPQSIAAVLDRAVTSG